MLLASHPSPLTRQGYQNLSAFFVVGMLSGFWLAVSNIYRRRLIINHIKNTYQFFIKGLLWHEGPIHQIYVRLVAQRDGKVGLGGEGLGNEVLGTPLPSFSLLPFLWPAQDPSFSCCSDPVRVP